MGKKRKHNETKAAEIEKKVEITPERLERTIFGFKTRPEDKKEIEKENDTTPFYQNKEKILVTCTRRISFRYRHLMLNIVELLPHCKKDNKVESKDSKGTTLKELVKLRSCSSCLFFECRKGKNLYLWMAKCPNGPPCQVFD